MALRNILNQSLRRHGSNRARQFSTSLSSRHVYEKSLPLLSTPWLILPPDIKDGPDGPTANYLNILDKTLVKIDRSDRYRYHGGIPPNTKCVGSTQGWVAFSYDSDRSIFLAHPYKQGCYVKLPPFEFDVYKEGLHCVLAGNPALESTPEFALVANEAPHRQIHVGNTKGWQKEEVQASECLLAYNRKANTVYKCQRLKNSKPLRISCWDVLRDNKIINTVELEDPFVDGHEQNKPLLYSVSRYTNGHTATVNYLVVGEEPEKSEPDLFLVVRHLEKAEGVQCETKGIELLRINLKRQKMEYVTSLGDQALFLGRNTDPFLLSTRLCPGLKSNSVYIADDLGVYDLETKCLTPFLSLGDLPSIRPQVYWLAPRSFL